MHSSEEGSAFEKSSRVFFLKGEQFSGCLSELGQGEMDSPYFSLILETVLANKLQLMIDSFLLEGPSRGVEGGRIYDRKYAYGSCSFCPLEFNYLFF